MYIPFPRKKPRKLTRTALKSEEMNRRSRFALYAFAAMAPSSRFISARYRIDIMRNDII
jgi:hypothetical protein